MLTLMLKYSVLHDTNCEQLCHGFLQVQQQQKSWHDYFQDMQNSCPHVSVSEEDLIWALQCVRSRAFSGPYSGT